MADEEVKQILHDLQLSNLEKEFSTNKVTIDVLNKLTEDLIKDLIPIIGDRAIFIDYWRKHFNNDVCNNKEFENKKRKRDDEESDESTSKENVSLLANNSHVFAKESLKPVKDVLMGSKVGKDILSSYDETKLLNDLQRKALVLAIVLDLENRSIRLTNSLAESIAKEVIDIFPSEAIETYYIPPVLKKNSSNNKSKIATGKLLSAYRNRLTRNKKLDSRLKSEEKAADVETIAEELDEDAKDSLDWLQNNQAPWNLVIENWKKTSLHRVKTLKESKDLNLINIFETWKLYKHPNGHELIDIDFHALNLSEVKLTKYIWSKFFDTLRERATLNSRDETATMLDKTRKSTNISEDSMIATTLTLLQHLYPPKQTKKIDSKTFKPSIGLAKDSILKFATIPGDLVRLRQETKSKAMQLKLPVQPFLICMGSIEEISEVYIAIDNEVYQVKGLVEGLDICFKIFHVFNLQYPLASEHFWLLIQKGIYKIELPTDPQLSSIAHALKLLSETDFTAVEVQANED